MFASPMTQTGVRQIPKALLTSMSAKVIPWTVNIMLWTKSPVAPAMQIMTLGHMSSTYICDSSWIASQKKTQRMSPFLSSSMLLPHSVGLTEFILRLTWTLAVERATQRTHRALPNTLPVLVPGSSIPLLSVQHWSNPGLYSAECCTSISTWKKSQRKVNLWNRIHQNMDSNSKTLYMVF